MRGLLLCEEVLPETAGSYSEQCFTTKLEVGQQQVSQLWPTSHGWHRVGHGSDSSMHWNGLDWSGVDWVTIFRGYCGLDWIVCFGKITVTPVFQLVAQLAAQLMLFLSNYGL